MKQRQSVAKTLFIGLSALAALSTLLIAAMILARDYWRFTDEIGAIRQQNVEAQKNLIKSEVEKVVEYIQYMSSIREKRLREIIKGRTNEAHALATHLYATYGSTLGPEDLKKLVIETLRSIRFNSGRGYYFATRHDGYELLFADRPDLEGQNLLSMQDTQGQFVIQDMIRLSHTSGEGFYEYTWTKPASQGQAFPKIAYIKYFAPFDGFIGTGEYLDDVEQDLQAEALERIRHIRFGKDGYIFVVSYTGTTLMNALQPELIGLDIWDMTDPYGVKVIQAERKAVESPEGDFIHYHWKRPTTGVISPKISFMKGIPNWGWMVGAGFYTDEADLHIAKLEKIHRQKTLWDLALFLAFLAILLLFSFAISYVVSRKFNEQVHAFMEYFRSVEEGHEPEQTPRFTIAEFESLAESAKRMLIRKNTTEQALLKSEERFTRAMEASKDGIWDWNLVTDEVYYSPGYALMLGYDPHELPPHLSFWKENLHPDDLDSSLRTAMDCVNGFRDEFEMEFRMKTKKGEWRWIFARGKVVTRDLYGHATRMTGTHTDITRRKRAEMNLSLSERRFRLLFENLPVGVLSINRDGLILDVNEAVVKIMGAPSMETSRNVNALTHPRLVEAGISADIRRCMETGEHILGEKPYVSTWGKSLHMRYHLAPTRDERGQISGVQILVEDFSAAQEAEKTRLALEDQLRQSQKMESIGRLAGGVAHDFNNLLTSIIGNVSLALMELSENDPLRDNLEQINQAAESAASVTRQLLAFSRKQVIEPKVIDLNTAIAQSLKMLRRLIGEDIELHFAPQAVLGRLRADPNQVEQILVNLCVNARDSMEKGGRLTLNVGNVKVDRLLTGQPDTVPPGDYILLSLSDTGVGMNETVLTHLFEPFYTTKEKGKGTGLGLAMVYGAVRQNHAFITVESELNRGTTFKIYWPMVEVEADPQAPVRFGNIPKGSETIVVVEDEEMVRSLALRLLKRLGYRVHGFSNGREALRALRDLDEPVHLLLTDVIMPGMNGKELAENVARIFPEIKILFTSGYTEEIISPHGILEDGIQFIPKPYTSNSLARKVREVLG